MAGKSGGGSREDIGIKDKKGAGETRRRGQGFQGGDNLEPGRGNLSALEWLAAAGVGREWGLETGDARSKPGCASMHEQRRYLVPFSISGAAASMERARR